jgi:GNAT superfamily N-acetyltransferase
VLWRVRTTMSDRPGSLAVLARHCGEQGVNILGMQIFPGVFGVTDELVLRAPDGWRKHDVALLVHDAGGDDTTVGPCTEHALVDGPIQYLHALHRVAHDPSTLVEMLARLLDADPAVAEGTDPTVDEDTLVVDVGPRRVLLRRDTPFTATEHARAIAFAEVARELVAPLDEQPGDQAYDAGTSPAPDAGAQPVVRIATFDDTAALTRMHHRCSADSMRRRYGIPPTQLDDRFSRRQLLDGGGALVAAIGANVVGVATISTCEDAVAEVSILVEDGWQRSGLGTRLLTSAARLARGQGAAELVLRSRTHHPALMALAFGSGLRARVRREGESVLVTVGLDGLKPLTTVTAATT